MKRNRGFSIIEVVLVLGVIGILSSFIVPKTRNYLAMAKDTKAINTLNNIRMASETYYLENGKELIEEEVSEEGKVLTGTDIEKIKKYMRDSNFQSDSSEIKVDIGGSKESKDTEEIKYGGYLNVYMNKNKEIIFKTSSEVFPYSIRGEKWEEI